MSVAICTDLVKSAESKLEYLKNK